ncbi:hypothetical protein GJ688_01935 [Heliobacillus mobilis]|uniref:Uncharacterized protein n=1 Tax=Heliobacterium mobile TaxID=28064 RepID=A0A6I3SBP8_HELMO|nr:hypothetical protein [Heliobacterium mobile]MTV47742.1 hypothetical protein [Heliobacterium mobile]
MTQHKRRGRSGKQARKAKADKPGIIIVGIPRWPRKDPFRPGKLVAWAEPIEFR